MILVITSGKQIPREVVQKLFMTGPNLLLDLFYFTPFFSFIP
jgi:hypothetical protein